MSSGERKVVLVTGATGLVGQAIRKVVETEETGSNEEYFFASSLDADLT